MTQDAVATMGTILPDDAGGRDAVHVAVFSAVSIEKLYPGQVIALVELREPDLVVRADSAGIAIVDPFLGGMVPPGARFWAYLFPRTITALSHRWSHPSFETVETTYTPPATKLASEKWLRDFCASANCPGYEEVMGIAARVANGDSGSDWDDEYMHFDGSDAHGEIPPEFWDHVSVVLGRPVKGPKAKYFSCSC